MSSASKDYGLGLKLFRQRDNFELQLQQSNQSYETFSAYLEWEKTHAKPQSPLIAQILFERAVAIHWQQPALWEDYAYYTVY
jgi:hypothetical protein